RNILRGLAAAPAVRQAWANAQSLDAAALTAAAAHIMRASEAALCQQHYLFALAESGNGLRLQARARTPELRSFMLASPDEAPRVWSEINAEDGSGQPPAPPSSAPPLSDEEGKVEKRAEVVDNLPPPAPDLGDPAEAGVEKREP
ncbi:MAG: hypothetical protein N3A66_04155, partial [Planctomycetota bacterium]|nr:hypothetical protein [Planctomycetota bacterium]